MVGSSSLLMELRSHDGVGSNRADDSTCTPRGCCLPLLPRGQRGLLTDGASAGARRPAPAGERLRSRHQLADRAARAGGAGGNSLAACMCYHQPYCFPRHHGSGAPSVGRNSLPCAQRSVHIAIQPQAQGRGPSSGPKHYRVSSLFSRAREKKRLERALVSFFSLAEEKDFTLGPQGAPWGPKRAPWGPKVATLGPQAAAWGPRPRPGGPQGAPWGPRARPGAALARQGRGLGAPRPPLGIFAKIPAKKTRDRKLRENYSWKSTFFFFREI